MEILILHPGALGDILLSLPALDLLRARFPQARVTLAANTDFAGTAARRHAHRVLSLASLPVHRLYEPAGLPQEDERFWRAYDRIVSWTGRASEQFTSTLAAIHPCVICSGWKPDTEKPEHVTRQFVKSLHPWLILPDVIPPPRVDLEKEDRLRGAEWLRKHGWNGESPVVAFHPGAGGPAKRWPLDRFAELAHRLPVDVSTLIVEGPAEPGLGASLGDLLGNQALLAASLPLGELAGILSHCRAFVGNDSGIAHLAAALGRACVVLFGPTDPRHWAPLGPDVSILRVADHCPACNQVPGAGHNCMASISVDVVSERLRISLGI